MSDDRPMRHEEYLAMAEENRRLTAEAERLKAAMAPKPRPPRSSTWSRIVNAVKPRDPAVFIVFWVLVILGGGGFTVAGVALYKAERDKREQQADPICYRVARRAGAPPWAPLVLFEVRQGRNVQWVRAAERDGKPVTFESSEEAAKFAHKYQLKVCP